MITIPVGVVPFTSPTTGEVLTGNRVTTYRWEVLEHISGSDYLVGYLDGVVDGSASLEWQLYSSVKGTGSLKVLDLERAQPGFMRLADLNLTTARLRPVLEIVGLPDTPWGVYLIDAAPEEWSGTGRVVSLSLLDRATVLDQDAVDETYVVDDSTPILQAVKTVIQSAGENIDVDADVTDTLTTAKVWDAGTTKLQIVNDLLKILYNSSLTVDGVGRFRASPYVVPDSRPVVFELVDGETSIYSEDWTRDQDFFNVPNKVVAVQSGGGDAPALKGSYSNTDPSSPFSYPSRGRWIVKKLDGVETPDGTDPEIIAFLDAKARQSLIASSSVQAVIEVSFLPVPVMVGDVMRFRNTPAGIDGRHVVTSLGLGAFPLGLMKAKLQGVIVL